jgi:hypothetical protein
VAGSTHCAVNSIQCMQPTCVQGTASLPHEALHMDMMTHYIYHSISSRQLTEKT